MPLTVGPAPNGSDTARKRRANGYVGVRPQGSDPEGGVVRDRPQARRVESNAAGLLPPSGGCQWTIVGGAVKLLSAGVVSAAPTIEATALNTIEPAAASPSVTA